MPMLSVSATALGVALSVLPGVTSSSPEPPQAVRSNAAASTVAAALVDWRSFTGFLSEGAGAASAGDEPRCSWAAWADPRRGVRTDGIEVSNPRYGVSQWADSRTRTNWRTAGLQASALHHHPGRNEDLSDSCLLY